MPAASAREAAGDPASVGSSFLDIEILAKATFLGHLIDEVDVPPLPGHSWHDGWWADWNQLFKHPQFKPIVRSSGRSEGPGRR